MRPLNIAFCPKQQVKKGEKTRNVVALVEKYVYLYCFFEQKLLTNF